MATVHSCRLACVVFGTVVVASLATAIWSVAQIGRIRSQADQANRIEVVEQEGILDIGDSGYPRGSGSPVQQGFVTFAHPFDSPPVVTITEQVPPFLYKRAAREGEGFGTDPFSPRLYRDRLADYEKQSQLMGRLFQVNQTGNGQGFGWTYSYRTYVGSPEYHVQPEDGSPRVVRWKARGIKVSPSASGEH
jgi:hypothetical protein